MTAIGVTRLAYHERHDEVLRVLLELHDVVLVRRDLLGLAGLVAAQQTRERVARGLQVCVGDHDGRLVAFARDYDVEHARQQQRDAGGRGETHYAANTTA